MTSFLVMPTHKSSFRVSWAAIGPASQSTKPVCLLVLNITKYDSSLELVSPFYFYSQSSQTINLKPGTGVGTGFREVYLFFQISPQNHMLSYWDQSSKPQNSRKEDWWNCLLEKKNRNVLFGYHQAVVPFCYAVRPVKSRLLTGTR